MESKNMYSIEQDVINQFLKIFDKYERCPRLNIRQNLFAAMESIDWNTFIENNPDFRKRRISKISNAMRYHWIASQCDLNKNSVYSWFAPNRDDKIPLRHLLRLSLILSVSLDMLLDSSAVITRNDIRKKKYDDMYDIVVEKHLEDPLLSYKEIADILGIASNTVNRHLKHYRESLE